MFPYNLRNYHPRIAPEEPISDKWIEKAKAIKADCIAKNGTAYRFILERLEVAYPPNYDSWWLKEDKTLPADVVWLEEK